jgi:DNA-3-methyladenine glycosylase I
MYDSIGAMKKIGQKRCQWTSKNDPLMMRYHDKEWGVPLRNDKKIFEFLCLESFQAGLSWRIILHKRGDFRNVFAGFDPTKIARFTKNDVNRLMNDKSIVRNLMKIRATINNARRFLKIKEEFGTFSKYMWGFVGNKPIVNTVRTMKDYTPMNTEAIIWSRDLKKRGFKFLGPTTLYSHMQAVGMVNDHMIGCFRKMG